MKTPPSYLITNVYLNENLRMPLFNKEDKGNYLVLWWKDIVLGDLFIDPDKMLPEKEYYEQITSAIQPAIDFYTKGRDLPGNYEWKHWLNNQIFEDWSSWCDQLFLEYTPVEIPDKVPVSVIICTRNRASSLQKCLNMLNHLSCKPEEIVVVDNAPSDDSTKEIVNTFEGVIYIKEPRAGLDIARNTGILNASCSIVTFIDDDVLVHPFCLLRVWETFENSSVEAMTGLVIASKLDTEAQLIFEKHWSFNRGYADKIYDNFFITSKLSEGPPVWEIGAGANMAFRKSIFEKVGYFNELLDAGAAGCNGDSEMWFRILLNGHNIHYNPRAVVFHEHRRELKDLFSQIFYYMRGYTAAALCQQQQLPSAGYKRKIFREFPKNYMRMIIKGFIRHPFQFKTIWPEIKGVLSGLIFFNKNKDRFLEVRK